MNWSVLRTVIKLLMLLALIFPIVLLTRIDRPKSPNLESFKNQIIKNQSNDSLIFFLGSSRVQASIDLSVMRSEFDAYKIYNCGMAQSTFLEACIVSEHLILQKGKKNIYIEISPFSMDITNACIDYCKEFNIKPWSAFYRIFRPNWRDYIIFMFEDMNQQLFSALSFKSFLSNALGSKLTKIDLDWFGYSSRAGSILVQQPNFLKPEDLTEQPSDIKLHHYLNAINYLIQLAERNDARITFYQSMTFLVPEEKTIAKSIFHELGSEHKLKYDTKFLHELSKSEWLYDVNHYNKEGAQYYSKALAELINSR